MKKGLLVTLLVLVAVALTFFSACQTGPTAEPPKSFELKLVETSDVHGAIFPYDFITDKESKTSLAQVMTYLNELRAVPGQEVILLDDGDILQGQPVVYYYNFEDTGEAHIQAQVMNYMGYEAGSVGNHDIEAGHPVYD